MKLLKPLKDVRILSLALNLPGPAALMRCRELGAVCIKLEPPGGDPMATYSSRAYAVLHQGVRVITGDLKTDSGQKKLHRQLAKADVLMTSFRPAALAKLALSWKSLHPSYPALSQIAIVGSAGSLASAPGHDLTYLASAGLLTGLNLPATLYADMGGALLAVQAVLQAVLNRARSGQGAFEEVALANAANWLALPHAWGLTQPGAPVGGGHAGYKVYACRDGRVAIAALEAHFSAQLCVAAGVKYVDASTMVQPATHSAVAAWLASKTCQQLDQLSHNIPLHTLT